MGMNLGLGLGLNSLALNGRHSKGPICEAIDKLKCVTFAHKKHTYLFAPHVVYLGPDGTKLADGIVVERDGKPSNKKKFETFIISDLSAIAVSDTPFTPEATFNPGSAEYDGEPICVVKIV